MEEVRSYWQVSSISHFCNIFGRPFKLPIFEPEELEQAFILDIPPPPSATKVSANNNINNNHTSTNDNHNGFEDDQSSPPREDPDPDYQLPPQLNRPATPQQQPQQQAEEQQELHLLVRLAIALLKPHFNCKIR